MQNVNTIELPKQYRFIDKKFRSLLFHLLGKLEGGQLTVHEGEQVHRFGVTDPDEYTLCGSIIILDASVYADFIRGGSIGAAQAYIDGKWDSPNLTKVIQVFSKAQSITDSIDNKTTWLTKVKRMLYHFKRKNNRQGSKQNILSHYDLSNELYTRFLDPSMMYSSAIFPTPETSLQQAQEHKLKTICERLQLTKDDHLLEIGTGWGGLAVYAAKHYGCKVTTTTISDAQFEYAKERVETHGLTDKITLLNNDYRDLTGQYDKLVSIEMIEAVGFDFMQNYFQKCNSLLKPEGKMLLQSITIKDQRFDYYLNNVDFIQRYIFPGGFLPSVSLITEQFSQHTNMVVEQLDDIGLDYAKTLNHWRKNFLKNWPEISQHGFDEQFKRLWLYYFCYCEGAFLERATSTVQIVARK